MGRDGSRACPDARTSAAQITTQRPAHRRAFRISGRAPTQAYALACTAGRSPTLAQARPPPAAGWLIATTNLAATPHNQPKPGKPRDPARANSGTEQPNHDPPAGTRTIERPSRPELPVELEGSIPEQKPAIPRGSSERVRAGFCESGGRDSRDAALHGKQPSGRCLTGTLSKPLEKPRYRQPYRS